MVNTGTKICVVCGQDCAGQPRTKDSKGHYYHAQCHADALARQEQAPVELELEPEPPQIDVFQDAFADLPTPSTAPQMCPSCATPVQGVLCTNCGTNLATGQSIKTQKGGARAAHAGANDGTIWPWVIGGGSVAFGLLAIGFNVIDMLSGGMPGDSDSAANTSGLAGKAIGLLLMVWFVYGGVNVMRRVGTEHIRKASAVLMFFSIACGVLPMLLIMGTGAGQDAMGRVVGSQGTELNIVIGVTIVILLLQTAWYAAVLIWTGRSSIKAQVANW